MRQANSYLPVAIMIVFGLAINVFTSSPVVYGDNVPGCQGTSSSAAQVILAGRIITPSSLLRTAGGQPCGANESAINMVSMTRTVIVSPKGTPSQNGAALLSAMTTIANANPSAANPYLLKLEPGQYDLVTQTLTMLPYVDLEGSGEDTTLISSTVGSASSLPTTGPLVAASHSEARFVTVANNGANFVQAGVYVPASATSARFTHLTASASGGSYNYGLINFSSGTVTVQNSTLTASGSSSYNYGLYTRGAGTVTVQNSTLSALGGSSNSGLYNFGSGTVTVQNSTLSASGGSFSFGLETRTGTIQIGASLLNGTTGPSNIIPGGTAKCIFSYRGDYATPLNAACG